jgi:hypothetical protein
MVCILQMSESIASSLGSNLNKAVTGPTDLKKILLGDDYFSDINPRSMRRLMNIIYITGELRKHVVGFPMLLGSVFLPARAGYWNALRLACMPACIPARMYSHALQKQESHTNKKLNAKLHVASRPEFHVLSNGALDFAVSMKLCTGASDISIHRNCTLLAFNLNLQHIGRNLQENQVDHLKERKIGVVKIRFYIYFVFVHDFCL